MTRYVGRHRAPQVKHWNQKKSLAVTLMTAGIINLYPITPAAEESRDESPLSPSPVGQPTPEPTLVIPEPPTDGSDWDEYVEWVEAGMPGYIPDDKSSKGLESEVIEDSREPDIFVPAAHCNADIGLSQTAFIAYERVCTLFPQVTTFYGYRAGDMDHGTGSAWDAMTYDDIATGNAVVDYLITHADELSVKYVIWQQRIWQPGFGWSWMEDRGSATANHADHVHASFY